MHEDIERILFGEQEIREGVVRVAGELTRAYAGDDPLLVAVLDGSVVFVADLIRRIELPVRLAFAWARSYRQGSASGTLAHGLLPEADDVRGRRVLLVDDILDSGRTLAALRDELRARGARDVRTCVLLDKPARRVVDLRPDHVAFVVPDAFVVGYGLDFAGRYRNLPYVGVLKASVLAAAEARA